MRTRLELGTSGSIDLLDNIPYSLNYAIADIREPDKRNSSYSKTIKIPGSKANNIIFAHIFEINIQSNFNANLKTPCSLYVDELLQMQGFLQLLKINKTDDNQIEYEVAIKGNVGNIFTDWADLQLTDLDLSAYNHTYNKTAQKASWVATYGEGYVYPMIDYSVTNALTFDVENFYPAIYVKQYIDAMFTLAGYTYSSSFLNTDFFKRLIIPFNSNTLLLTAADLLLREFQSKRNANVTLPDNDTFPLNSDFYTSPFDADVIDTSNQYNTSSYEFTATQSGNYVFRTDQTFTVKYVTAGTYTGNGFNIFIIKKVGSVETTLAATTIALTDAGLIPANTTTASIVTALETTTIHLNAGEKVFVRTRRKNYEQGGDTYGWDASRNYYMQLNLLANSTFQCTAINTGLFDGNTLSLNNAIPRNIKIKDFFTSIIKMFNLYIETDKTIDNKLYIEPRNDFYAAGVTKDWTDKLSIDRVMDIDPMGELNASRYTFKYKEDKDYYNQKYQNGFLEPYGTMNKDIDTDFIKGTKTLEVIFSPTPLSKTGTTDRIISQISTLGNDGLGLTNIKNCNLRILYFDLKNTNDSWQYTGSLSGTTTETTYPYAGHVDIPLLPTIDLNFGVPKEIYYITSEYTNNNLYNKYYKKYIEEITDKDSKIITAYFYLTPLDIYLLDFRNQFFVDGNLLRLNKIYDYNPLSNELTKCEFIKIKEALPFVAQLNVAVGVIGPAYDTGDDVPILVNTGTVGPISTFVGNGSVVDTTVVNSVVLGTANYVGGGSGNVGIFGSSGVTVFPGVTDVFVLNSNNIVVTESNISVVNGVFLPSGSQSEQGITAYAGGGQTNGYQTTKKFNLIETVATTADSIKTILATLNAEQTFKNVGANSMTVYPKLGEQFRRGTTLLGANVGYAVASRNSLHIYCYEDGIWTD